MRFPGFSSRSTDALDVWTDPAIERLWTPATTVTFARTVATVVISGVAIREASLTLLVVALGVHWVGDILDGRIARWFHHETRIGAVVDIMCDRLGASAFYLGLAWLHPEFTLPVLVYLFEFMVLDNFLSIAFLAWRIRSPNYFYVIDPLIYRLNWTDLAKTANSGLFAVLLLVTRQPWLGLAVALAVVGVKIFSLARLFRIGLPIPREPGPAPAGQAPG